MVNHTPNVPNVPEVPKVNKWQDYINEHNAFYTIGYRKLINFLFILLFIIFLLLALIIYQEATRTLPTYFVTTLDGRLIQIQPISAQKE